MERDERGVIESWICDECIDCASTSWSWRVDWWVLRWRVFECAMSWVRLETSDMFERVECGGAEEDAVEDVGREKELAEDIWEERWDEVVERTGCSGRIGA